MVGIVLVYIFYFVSALLSSMWCATNDFVKQAVTEILLGRSMKMGSTCAMRNECYTWISIGVMMQRNSMSSRDAKYIYAKIDKSI